MLAYYHFYCIIIPVGGAAQQVPLPFDSDVSELRRCVSYRVRLESFPLPMPVFF